MRRITFIGVPMDLGAGRRGVDMGPSAFRAAAIHEAVRALGYEVHDAGDLNVCIHETRDPGDPRLRFLTEIRETCESLRDNVRDVLAEGSMPLLLGGDHSLAIGSIAGLSAFYKDRGQPVGLIWIDAHGDMNTAETSPSGNIHGMPLAVALGLGEPSLVGLAGSVPMVHGRHASVVGLRDVDVAERENLKRSGIAAFTMRAIDERGMRSVMEEAITRAASGTAGIHVSIDLDAFDPTFAPGVGTPSVGGISFREAHLAMEMLADSGRVLSAEFVEVNPILDDRNRTAHLGVGLIASLLGKKIL